MIQRTYTATPFPGAIVSQGDKLGDTITASADVLDNTTLTPDGNSVTDISQAVSVISAGNLEKTVYEINGVAPSGANPNDQARGRSNVPDRVHLAGQQSQRPGPDRLSPAPHLRRDTSFDIPDGRLSRRPRRRRRQVRAL